MPKEREAQQWLENEPQLRKLFGKLRHGPEKDALRALSEALVGAFDAGRRQGQSERPAPGGEP